MDSQEFTLNYHELKLEVELSRRNGLSFHEFFERIMQKFDKPFLMVKPSGRVGDWESDGYPAAAGTIYQCFTRMAEPCDDTDGNGSWNAPTLSWATSDVWSCVTTVRSLPMERSFKSPGS